MKTRLVWIPLAVAFLLTLTACPGGLPGNVSVVATGAYEATYRLAGGEWQLPDDPEQFNFVALGGYEVAVRCDDSVSIWALTTADTGTLNVPCPTNDTSFTVTYDATAVAGTSSVMLFYKGSTKLSSSASGTFLIDNGVEGLQDLVLVAYDNSGSAIAAKMLTATVHDGDTFSITLAASDAGHLKSGGSVADFSGQVPAGWGFAGAMVGTVTPNGTTVMLEYLTSSGGSYTSLDFADYDAVTASARDSVVTTTKTLMHLQTASSTAASFNVRLPEQFAATISHDALPTFSGLSRSEADLLGYHLNLEWGSSPTYSLSALVSKSYLGSRTSYTMPDLTGVSGFEEMAPASGDAVTAAAEYIDSNRSWSDMAAAGLNGPPTNVKGLDLKIGGVRAQYTAP
ncbi:hypothetical protein [Oceanithermus sp.]